MQPQNPPSKIHLTTRAYLKRWTVGGLLRPMHRRYGRQKLKHPSAVAYERDWWSKDNPALNAVCEEQCGKLETLIPELLPRVRGSWPLDLGDRAVLAQFMALHVARTPAFADWFRGTRDESLPKYRDRFETQGQYDQFCAEMRSDQERAKKILSQINKLGTMLGSMHWTLVFFEEPLLVTSDQPVAPVPLLEEGEQEVVSPTPTRGWLDTIEVRFPLSPHEALLGTWYGSPYESDPILGDWAAAVAINGVTKAQAERYYQSPARFPAMPPAILREPVEQFEPLSPRLLPGYSTAVARVSDRRLNTKREITRLIESSDDTTLTVIAPEARAAA